MHDKIMTIVTGLLVVALAATSAACTSESQSSRPSGANSGASTVEVTSVDVCKLLAVTDVAKALGHDAATGTSKLTAGRFATDCTYTFEHDGVSKYAMVWVYPVELWAPEARDGIEEVSGLGDAAYLTTNGFTQMHVLVDGVIYIDARADTPDQARRLAEIALFRLAQAKP